MLGPRRVQKQIFSEKKIWARKFVVEKHFGSVNNFCQKKILGPKINCWFQKNTGSQKNTESKNNLGSKQFFGLPSKIVFHQRFSSINVCLSSKVVFHQRFSSIKVCLPPKVVFYQRSIPSA